MRKRKPKSNPSLLFEEAKGLAKVKSNRAFAEIIDLPYSTVQNWSEGKGSAIAIRLLETYIENKELETRNDALLLLMKDKTKWGIEEIIKHIDNYTKNYKKEAKPEDCENVIFDSKEFDSKLNLLSEEINRCDSYFSMNMKSGYVHQVMETIELADEISVLLRSALSADCTELGGEYFSIENILVYTNMKRN